MKSRTKEEEFEKIYHEMYGELRDYSWHYLIHHNSLEEVLQDTFHDIYANMNKVLKAENYRAWIYGCLKNNMKEAIRKEIINRNREVSYEAVMDETMTDGADFTERIIAHETLLQIANKKELQNFYMQYVEGYSPAEIAKLENVTEGQYKMQMSRTKKKLEKRLRKAGYESSNRKKS